MAWITARDIKNSAVTAIKLATDAVTAAKIAAGAVTTPKLANGAVSLAKTMQFISAPLVGTGAEQNVAHGLPGIPAKVVLVPVEGHNGAGAQGTQMPTLGQGVHDGTNVKVTCPAGAKFTVIAWM